MKNVFISYSSKDSKKAIQIVSHLEEIGIDCWLSQRDIPPGADYAIEIPKALNNCDYFVLLLTNDAQNSPYVMLELDQAFRLKKEIIPICLENVVQNEKTNFFLNAKQCVDATDDLTTAMNDVIRRIGVNMFPLPRRNNHLQVMNQVAQKDKVCCPHCKGKILKRKPCFMDGYINQRKTAISEEKMMFWLVKNGMLLNRIIAILSGIWLASLAFLTAKDEMDLILKVLWCICIAGVFSVFFIFATLENVPNVQQNILQAVQNSKLEYVTFKCAKCEEEFGILLPKGIPLEDQVEVLLSEDPKKEE